jgi:hypothetical protein
MNRKYLDPDVDKSIRDEITECSLNWLARHSIPYSILEDEELRKQMSGLPSSETFSQRMKQETEKKLNEIIPKLKT